MYGRSVCLLSEADRNKNLLFLQKDRQSARLTVFKLYQLSCAAVVFHARYQDIFKLSLKVFLGNYLNGDIGSCVAARFSLFGGLKKHLKSLADLRFQNTCSNLSADFV